MKQFLVAMVVLMVSMLATACGDTETTIDGPVPVTIEGTVLFESCESDCVTDADCGAQELCLMNEPATGECGYLVMQCRIGCDAKLETTTNEDGTSTTNKVEGSDTCQRDGDISLFCDLGSHMCKEYMAEETDVVEPDTDVTPEPDVTPIEPNMAEIECCYGSHTTGLYGAFAWSMSTPDDPEKWTGIRDLTLDKDGCFSAEVDMDTVFLGFWADLTVGPAKGKADDDIVWVGDEMKPYACSIGGVGSSVGGWNLGWKFGPAALK